MAKPRINDNQRAALTECRLTGRLIRRRDGWAPSQAALGAHGFTTVYSLLTRGLVTDQGQPKNQVAITALGREALS